MTAYVLLLLNKAGTTSFFVFLHLQSNYRKMKVKMTTLAILLLYFIAISAQVPDSLNKTDVNGNKQGHWIKEYPNGNVLYDGWFANNKPTGEFKRYYENLVLQSVLRFSNDGTEADAAIYHPNGFIASKGKFINQLREGRWKFYSPKAEGYLIVEEEYKANIRNGFSNKYYPDSLIAERLTYNNGKKNGEWIQYYSNGIMCLKANYKDGKLNGIFMTYFNNGKPEYSGQYKNDAREGSWIIYNPQGSVRSKIDYVNGMVKNPGFYKDASDLLDELDKNKGKIPDPEKTDEFRK
jgi:antitoxin component YwqK of YwqJK toxin-antitoxin module